MFGLHQVHNNSITNLVLLISNYQSFSRIKENNNKSMMIDEHNGCRTVGGIYIKEEKSFRNSCRLLFGIFGIWYMRLTEEYRSDYLLFAK